MKLDVEKPIEINPDYTYLVNKIVKITDGDTYHFDLLLSKRALDLGFNLYSTVEFEFRAIVRLRYFNTPEIFRPSTPEEKALGLKAKEFAELELRGAEKLKVITYKDKTEKYGRYIAEVVYWKKGDETMYDLGEELVRNGLAVTNK